MTVGHALDLLRIPAGADPLAYVEEALERAEVSWPLSPSASDAGELDPQREAWKEALAVVLCRVEPSLERFQPNFAAIARSEGTSEAEARHRHRELELNSVDKSGIQITVWDEAPSVTLPFWHGRRKAVAVWRRIWACLEVLEREGGLRTYDPQLERVLDLATDFEQVVESYLEC